MPMHSARDLRIDIFRGLALIIIFIDHVPGNWLARLTPVNFGFSNAADVFVLLAGMSAAHAYFPIAAEHGYRAVLVRLMRRIAQIYCAHVGVLWFSIAALAVAIHFFDRADFMGHEIPASLPAGLGSAAWGSLTLTLQPKYLDILPLYVVLLLFAPPLIFLERYRRGLGLAMSLVLWLVTECTGFSLPSSRSPAGWYFNPFAWQLLFCVGLASGIAHLQGATLPRSRWGIAVAIAYILLAFVTVSPCHFESVGQFCHLRAPDVEVTHLTVWRIGHILALGYLAAVMIPATAPWLFSRVAQLLALLGRNSLSVFLAGVVMSLLGSVMLTEYGTEWGKQLVLNVAGLLVLVLTAFWRDRPARDGEPKPSMGHPLHLGTAGRKLAAVLMLAVAGGAAAYVALANLQPVAAGHSSPPGPPAAKSD